MARAVRLVSRETDKEEVRPCSERQLAGVKKRKAPVLHEDRYPELSAENDSRSEDISSGHRPGRYIPPGNHPWRRFRLPGSPPDKKAGGWQW